MDPPINETWNDFRTNIVRFLYNQTKTLLGFTSTSISSLKTDSYWNSNWKLTGFLMQAHDFVTNTVRSLCRLIKILIGSFLSPQKLASSRLSWGLYNFMIRQHQTLQLCINKLLDFVKMSVGIVTSTLGAIFKRIGSLLTVTFVVSFIIVPLGILSILFLLGFTFWGVSAFSFAASRQSAIGDVPANSCFALMQSLAAGGNFKLLFRIGLVIGVPSGVIACIYGWPWPNK